MLARLTMLVQSGLIMTSGRYAKCIRSIWARWGGATAHALDILHQPGARLVRRLRGRTQLLKSQREVWTHERREHPTLWRCPRVMHQDSTEINSAQEFYTDLKAASQSKMKH